ncbi:MAG: ISAs1 family transposase [Cyanobacteria bacterium P01_H01_bin.153]
MSSPAIESNSLLQHFASLEDPRVEYLVEHRILDIIALTICGADNWVEIEAYGHSKAGWLQSFGISSHDIISRLFVMLDLAPLQGCFANWIKAIAELSEGEVVAIDGKCVRHSYDTGKGKGVFIGAMLGPVRIDWYSDRSKSIASPTRSQPSPNY